MSAKNPLLVCLKQTVLLVCFALAVGSLVSCSQHTNDNESARLVENLSSLHFDRLGHPQIKTDAIQPVLANAERPHRLLVIPIEFPELGYDRFAGETDANQKNRDYLQKLLFGGSRKTVMQDPKPNTLTHYYRHQSKGRYNITGEVLPIVKVPRPLSYYGRPVQSADGSWRQDNETNQLVVDSLKAAYHDNPEFPWQDYDIWDPNDFDGDGNRDEADGYLDHLIIVYAGKGQSSCQGLYKLSEKFTVNAPADIFNALPFPEQQCADRIWPHRSSLPLNIGKGPEIEEQGNGRGGVELGNGLWVYDYNMQPEYTEIATFIHEFGHSLGLPDIYARATNNSTASWEVMSSTVSPYPQEMSAWSRMMLGWLEPCIIKPEEFGGSKHHTLHLKAMNNWSGKVNDNPKTGNCDAAMIILPPKFRELNLGPLGETQGEQAAYTGQGNSMNHYLTRTFDLRTTDPDQPLTLTFDTWFTIETDWDYLYVEVSGENDEYERLLPVDKENPGDTNSVMPSKQGHEGKNSLPGFTGRSGDKNGDGKVEIAPDCDPKLKRVLAEDKVGKEIENPCDISQWISASFDLEQWRGQQASIRFHYFTDGAAVENGALIDNLAIDAIGYREDFETDHLQGWTNQGFSLSGGYHRLAVPHFYLLEYRDPYEQFASVKNYDTNLNKPNFAFYRDNNGEMKAFNANYRPGVLMWYYNGEYLWSQNEPAQFGPGRGFLLLVDANPQEFHLPAVPETYYKSDGNWRFYQFNDAAQPWLQQQYVDVMCHQRREIYYSSDVPQSARDQCQQSLNGDLPPVESLHWNNKQLIYGYSLINEILPGPEREKHQGVLTLFDLRLRNGETQYRLYDRFLRNRHSADAPFSLNTFTNGTEIYRIKEQRLVRESATEFPPVSSFDDTGTAHSQNQNLNQSQANPYQNPHLPFGGVDVPEAGLTFKLVTPDDDAPKDAKVKIAIEWEK